MLVGSEIGGEGGGFFRGRNRGHWGERGEGVDTESLGERGWLSLGVCMCAVGPSSQMNDYETPGPLLLHSSTEERPGLMERRGIHGF